MRLLRLFLGELVAEESWPRRHKAEWRPRAVLAHRRGGVALAGLPLRTRLTFGELVAELSGKFILLTFDRLVELLLQRWADAILFA